MSNAYGTDDDIQSAAVLPHEARSGVAKEASACKPRLQYGSLGGFGFEVTMIYFLLTLVDHSAVGLAGRIADNYPRGS